MNEFRDQLGCKGDLKKQLSHEKRAFGWLGYIGDEILPSYIGIIINHYKDPYINQPGFNGKSKGFFSWLNLEDRSLGHLA